MRQGIFLPVSTFSADSLTVSVYSCAQSHAVTSVCTLKTRGPCQSSVDQGNAKTPSMHPRLGSATLLQLAFPGEGNPNFPWEKSHWDNTVVNGNSKNKKPWSLLLLFVVVLHVPLTCDMGSCKQIPEN